MNRAVRLPFVTAFVLIAAASLLVAQAGRQDAAHAERFVKLLQIEPGQTVGEVGAGDGTLTIAIAKAVGPSGRILSNELNADRVKTIARAAEQAGLTNVTVVGAGKTETRFPDQCCDALFMRDVYHHFGEPREMNASLFRSLKPGGRLGVIDFGPPPGQESTTPSQRSVDGHHGITAPTLERELKSAGFEILSSKALEGRLFIIVAQRPQ
jgi:ubiquinone/menaquinone biosynthesis C-methylase UbiE